MTETIITALIALAIFIVWWANRPPRTMGELQQRCYTLRCLDRDDDADALWAEHSERLAARDGQD